jgi:UDP-N-acetylmuramate-alanine ligase
VAHDAQRAGVRALYEPVRSSLARTTVQVLEVGDVLLTLGAGDITSLGREVRPLLLAR